MEKKIKRDREKTEEISSINLNHIDEKVQWEIDTNEDNSEVSEHN